MKLVEIVCACSLLTFFTGGFSFGLNFCFKIASENKKIYAQIKRDDFLSKGFARACRDKQVEKWIELSSSLYPDCHLRVEKKEEGYIQFWNSEQGLLSCSSF